MPDTTDADRRPVPYRRTAPPEAERWTGNWATEHPPEEPADSRVRRPPQRHGGRKLSADRWSGWLAAVLMLAAAAFLFWAPWKDSPATGTATGAAAAANGSAAGAPAPDHGGTAAGGGIVPTRIDIPAIGVNTTVEHRGTVRTKNPFTGRMVTAFGVPSSMRTTSWWSDGPEPGSGQMAVILGHTQVGGYGVFNHLDRLQRGSPLTLSAANGATLHLQVLGPPVTGLDKATSALSDTLNQHPAGAAVALVTCGGQFDQDVHASEDNVVVFASVVPAG